MGFAHGLLGDSLFVAFTDSLIPTGGWHSWKGPEERGPKG